MVRINENNKLMSQQEIHNEFPNCIIVYCEYEEIDNECSAFRCIPLFICDSDESILEMDNIKHMFIDYYNFGVYSTCVDNFGGCCEIV